MLKVMERTLLCFTVLGFTALLGNCGQAEGFPVTPLPADMATVKLPEPEHDSDYALERSLLERRSTRTFSDGPLNLEEISQLLWATQGITDARGFRTAPSAGALYPLEVYVVVGKVETLAPGIYRYYPDEHLLSSTITGDKRKALSDASLSQGSITEGAVSIIITAVYSRTTVKYGDRGVRYVHIEVGHAAQNLCLQATSMGLGLVTIGAFDDQQIADLLHLPDDEQVLYVIPVGRK